MKVFASIDLIGIAVIAVIILIAVGGLNTARKRIRRRVRSSMNELGSAAALAGLAAMASQLDMKTEESPKSLSGGDSLFLPQILKDFPDFNLESAKEKVRSYMIEKFADAQDFGIHNVIISDYRRASFEKTVVFQCAYELTEEGSKRQKRCCVHYSYRVSGSEGAYSAPNCPNCGAPVTTGSAECPYCGARLFMTEAAWLITDWYEK